MKLCHYLLLLPTIKHSLILNSDSSHCFVTRSIIQFCGYLHQILSCTQKFLVCVTTFPCPSLPPPAALNIHLGSALSLIFIHHFHPTWSPVGLDHSSKPSKALGFVNFLPFSQALYRIRYMNVTYVSINSFYEFNKNVLRILCFRCMRRYFGERMRNKCRHVYFHESCSLGGS